MLQEFNKYKPKAKQSLISGYSLDVILNIISYFIGFFIIIIIIIVLSLFYQDFIKDTDYFIDGQSAELFEEDTAQETEEQEITLSELNENIDLLFVDDPTSENEEKTKGKSVVDQPVKALKETVLDFIETPDKWFVQLGVCNFNECITRIKDKMSPYLYTIKIIKTETKHPLITLTSLNFYTKLTALNFAAIVNKQLKNQFHTVVRKANEEKSRPSYYLFFGVYSSIEQAKQNKRSLEDLLSIKDFRLKINLIERKIGKSVVLTGPFSNKKDALKNKERIRNIVGIDDAFVPDPV